MHYKVFYNGSFLENIEDHAEIQALLSHKISQQTLDVVFHFSSIAKPHRNNKTKTHTLNKSKNVLFKNNHRIDLLEKNGNKTVPMYIHHNQLDAFTT